MRRLSRVCYWLVRIILDLGLRAHVYELLLPLAAFSGAVDPVNYPWRYMVMTRIAAGDQRFARLPHPG